MAISEKQLETWSHQGAITTSASTYNSIKKCIGNGNWKDDVHYEVYLQGSYKNSTNIYGNSDVDIVVQFNSIYSYSTINLNAVEKQKFNRDFVEASYTLKSFKTAIIKRLRECYGDSNVVVNDKAILVKGNGSNRLDADVLVCNPYRKYKSYTDTSINYVEGIVFDTEYTNKRIINYPKVHYKNGVEKNSRTSTYSNFKSIVRILKNIKATMVNKNIINKKLAPSYFLECLIYNANNNHFRQYSYSPICIDIINQFVDDVRTGNIENYLVQNEQRYLFGNGDQQWNLNDAKTFVGHLVNFWNNS